MNPNIILQQISIEELIKIINESVREQVRELIIPQSKPEPEPDFITRLETAQILGISLPTLNEWTKRGIIPSYRISSRIRYKKEEVLNSVKNVKYGRG